VFQKDGELAKQAVRPGVGPGGRTLKRPDADTITAFVVAHEVFETFLEDGRLWVFKSGSKELDQCQQHHELEKQVIRVNVGPLGMTIKAPDDETIETHKSASGTRP
jgi:hypothetical protein